MNDGSPGFSYAVGRLWRTAFPKLTIRKPKPGIVFERDVAVTMRDSVKLRVNVFRPEGAGRFPVIMSAHPYGKDALPKKTPFGYLPPARYRFLRTPDPITFSAWTSWESPDPCYWVPRGYAFVNVDLRGFGASEGIGVFLSDEEAEDYAEVIEWAAGQPWSTGKVGLNGVSYLAISQWKVAALNPPSLAAICPWEGFTDFYHDVAYPGGVREDGFVPFWAGMTERQGRTTGSLRRDQLNHPEWDSFWQATVPDLERIKTPALICASFSDHGLHSRGSFEAFRRISSAHRFLYTHRGGKWSSYYSGEALDVQTRFFDCFLKGEENGLRSEAPVRLEVRTSAREVHEVRQERSWPLPETRWTILHLAPGLLGETPSAPAMVRFAAATERASFTFTAPEDIELAGPMKLRLYVELVDSEEVNLFAAVRKLAGGRVAPFEGSFGFSRDTVTKGWLRIARRPGVIEPAEIELLPSATFFRRGEILRLDVQGRWFWRRSMFFGTFPGDYAPSTKGAVVLHMGDPYDAHLLVPRTR
ncbi:MAG: CocE/NonD family hydrolase [Acidobacteriota bacterium]|nr:CocE/NonD family hydrolase [Acidobacteriota bacterium]